MLGAWHPDAGLAGVERMIVTWSVPVAIPADSKRPAIDHVKSPRGLA
jgi:hypothetical protein